MTVNERLENASRYGVPPYIFIPPETLPLTITQPLDQRPFEGPPWPIDQCNAFKNKNNFEEYPGDEDPDDDAEFKIRKVPHPLSDTTHEDPLGPDEAPDFTRLKEKVQNDNRALRDVKTLERMVGDPAPGMQRLSIIFQFLLCRITDLLAQMNTQARAYHAASKPGDKDKAQAAYTEIRNRYLELVNNLDNHEPQIRMSKRNPDEKRAKKQIDPIQGLGYGKSIKWFHIEVVVKMKNSDVDPAVPGNYITGASIVIKWNPHSCSNGKPIIH